MSTGTTCHQCGREGRITGAVGVGRAGEPACRRHVMRRPRARTRAVALRRAATSYRRARAAQLRFLGDVKAAKTHASNAELAEVLGVDRRQVIRYRQEAEREGAVS